MFFLLPCSRCLLSLPSAMEDGEYRNWAELPPELTSAILVRLGTIDILENVQKVCKSWHRVCKNPWMWRNIDLLNIRYLADQEYNLESMCRHVVDRSQGGLVKINLSTFCTDELLNYIADSSCNLKSLTIFEPVQVTEQGFVSAIVKLSLIEDLRVLYCPVSGESLKVVGKSCPNLKKLTVFRHHVYKDNYAVVAEENDDEALAIAETMPGLHHLGLVCNPLSDAGLISVLDNCPNLEHLDLLFCDNVNFVGDLRKRCYERIKAVRRPSGLTNVFNASQIWFPRMMGRMIR